MSHENNPPLDACLPILCHKSMLEEKPHPFIIPTFHSIFKPFAWSRDWHSKRVRRQVAKRDAFCTARRGWAEIYQLNVKGEKANHAHSTPHLHVWSIRAPQKLANTEPPSQRVWPGRSDLLTGLACATDVTTITNLNRIPTSNWHSQSYHQFCHGLEIPEATPDLGVIGSLALGPSTPERLDGSLWTKESGQKAGTVAARSRAVRVRRVGNAGYAGYTGRRRD